MSETNDDELNNIDEINEFNHQLKPLQIDDTSNNTTYYPNLYTPHNNHTLLSTPIHYTQLQQNINSDNITIRTPRLYINDSGTANKNGFAFSTITSNDNTITTTTTTTTTNNNNQYDTDILDSSDLNNIEYINEYTNDDGNDTSSNIDLIWDTNDLNIYLSSHLNDTLDDIPRLQSHHPNHNNHINLTLDEQTTALQYDNTHCTLNDNDLLSDTDSIILDIQQHNNSTNTSPYIDIESPLIQSQEHNNIIQDIERMQADSSNSLHRHQHSTNNHQLYMTAHQQLQQLEQLQYLYPQLFELPPTQAIIVGVSQVNDNMDDESSHSNQSYNTDNITADCTTQSPSLSIKFHKSSKPCKVKYTKKDKSLKVHRSKLSRKSHHARSQHDIDIELHNHQSKLTNNNLMVLNCIQNIHIPNAVCQLIVYHALHKLFQLYDITNYKILQWDGYSTIKHKLPFHQETVTALNNDELHIQQYNTKLLNELQSSVHSTIDADKLQQLQQYMTTLCVTQLDIVIQRCTIHSLYIYLYGWNTYQQNFILLPIKSARRTNIDRSAPRLTPYQRRKQSMKNSSISALKAEPVNIINQSTPSPDNTSTDGTNL